MCLSMINTATMGCPPGNGKGGRWSFYILKSGSITCCTFSSFCSPLPNAGEGSCEKIEIKFDCGSPRPNGEREGVKKSPPILGGDEARQGFGGGKGRV
jgi:hypothetical protein